MLFVYAPTMLIMLPDYFTLGSFIQVSITYVLGVFNLAAAITEFLFAPLNPLLRLFFATAGILLVAPSPESDIAGVISPWSCVPMSLPGTWRTLPGILLDPLGPLAIRPSCLPRFLPWAMRFMKAGEVVADILAGRRATIDLGPYRPKRFS